MRRYEELDSLRGLAALTVVFSHFMIIFNVNGNNTYHTGFVGNWYKYSPLHIFWAGHEAVMLFFVLSGFVLALPFLNQNSFSYREYLIKRFFRIYPASIISVLVSLCFISMLDNDTRPIDSQWISTFWLNNASIQEIISEIFLIGNVEVSLNPVLWSLIHEIRLSITFPLIVYCVIKLSWKKNLILALALSVIGFGMTALLDDPRLSLWVTLRYSAMFMVGAFLAKYRNTLIQTVSKLKSVSKAAIFLIAVVLYTFSWLFNDNQIVNSTFTSDWLTTVGCSIFIILSLSLTKVSNVLKNRNVSFFGKISYSLYLYHLIFLIFFMKFNSGLSIPTTLVLTFIVSVITAKISYEYIEKPFIKAGRHIAKRFRKMDSRETHLKSSGLN